MGWMDREAMPASNLFEMEIVGSGDRRVSGRNRRYLVAFLGSCVGVTLCDRNSGLGGMIHFLLPQPTVTGVDMYAARYASTGLPKFLNELEQAGARRENLSACMAGGALVGDVSKLDLNLDIGGRTTMVVEQILTQSRIPIVQSETGGYFTCKMSLNLSTFETTIEPVSDMSRSSAVPLPLSSEMDFPGLIRRLKPIPQVALKILRMIDDQDCQFSEIADEVKQDQTISAKVLHICNSSFFGRGRRVDSIERALTNLGERNLIKFIVSALLEQFFFSSAGGYSLCKGGLYRHALGTAQVAERLARLTGMSSPEPAYTGGLLHDIGKVVLDQHVARFSPFFYRQVLAAGRPAIEVEREVLGTDHTQLGAMLAVYWGFPDNLKDVARYHHLPEQAPGQAQLVTIVHLADLIMSRFAAGHELERIDTQNLGARLKVLGLAPDRMMELVDVVPHQHANP